MNQREAKIRPLDFTNSYERSQFEALDRTANRLSFLSEVSRRLSFALSDQECFQQLVELMVPAFADVATISLLTDEGKIRRVALAHANPEKSKIINILLNNYTPSLDDSYGPGLVIRTRKPDYDRDFDSHLDSDLKRYRYPGLVQIVRTLGVRSRICVPLEAHGQILGAIWMITSDSERRFELEDLKLAQEVANRAALSVYHLLRYDKATVSVEKLQVERDVREAYLSQVRHDVLSVLTTATLSAELMAKRDPQLNAVPAQRIVQAIERASEILRSTRREDS